MQTRTRARVSAGISDLPTIPDAVQLLILDHLAAIYPEPDRIEYILWPYKSTLAWLLSLRFVCKHWDQHLQQLPVCTRRKRLEALRNLSLQHDYAHYIVTTRRSKRERVNAVPRKMTLRFVGNSCSTTSTVSIPRGLTQAEKSGGLPSNTLMIVTPFDQLSLFAFKQLLADINCLDQHHSAPMVLKVTTAAISSSRMSSIGTSPQQPHNSCIQHKPSLSSEPSQTVSYPGSPDVVAADTADQPTHASNLEQLVAVVAPLLQHCLPHIVMEGSAASGSLYFIPTKQGFCRRLPLCSAP